MTQQVVTEYKKLKSLSHHQQEERADPQSRNLGRTHLPNSDQIVDKVPGGVGLSVLLVGGVSHPDVVEAIDTHLQGGEFRSQMWTSALKQTQSDTHLTHELLPVLVPCSSDVIAGSQLLFSTPGVQEVFDVRHGGLTVRRASSNDLKTER